jgi:hypothetical protein
MQTRRSRGQGGRESVVEQRVQWKKDENVWSQ